MWLAAQPQHCPEEGGWGRVKDQKAGEQAGDPCWSPVLGWGDGHCRIAGLESRVLKKMHRLELQSMDSVTSQDEKSECQVAFCFPKQKRCCGDSARGHRGQHCPTPAPRQLVHTGTNWPPLSTFTCTIYKQLFRAPGTLVRGRSGQAAAPPSRPGCGKGREMHALGNPIEPTPLVCWYPRREGCSQQCTPTFREGSKGGNPRAGELLNPEKGREMNLPGCAFQEERQDEIALKLHQMS